MLAQFNNPIVLILLIIVFSYSIVLWRFLVKLRALKKGGVGPLFLSNPGTHSQDTHDLSVQRFKDKADEAMLLSTTFQKFVPKQFVAHFAKHGSESLELGRADEDEVAILFCDIRGFTGLSERMSPQELMKFLNSYFLRMNDPIHQNGGFIDKFIGDAIMALFDNPAGENEDKARDALKAAIDLRAAISIYNQHRRNSNYPPINIGIGIHFGPVIIGTVGSDDRMDTTVIGDSVNIAFRLETLAPKYNTDIVVSAQTLKVAKASGKFKYRVLDWVRVKGRKAPIEIYEVIDHQAPSIQELKLANADLIQKGLNCRIQRQWPEAMNHFRDALIINPQDSLVMHHLEQCHLLQRDNLPQDWDGALIL